MDSQPTSWAKIISTLAVLAVVGARGIDAAGSWINWFATDLPGGHWPLPWFRVLLIARPFLEGLVCVLGILGLLKSPPWRHRLVLAALLTLLTAHAIDWCALTFAPAAAAYSFLEWHGPLIIYAVILLVLAAAWAPNNSFKPNPLRGSA